ncbi:beta strand repeat-containing protein, partial [Paraburkholderia sp. J69-1]|uniref:beta strand repeat-containing protein n=1 Tax=unclassified Paraburkholderia TaxID=2615204 RepID=UPI0039EF4709
AAITVISNAVLSATAGSVTLTGAALTGADLTATAGGDISAQDSVEALGDLAMDAESGSATLTGAVSVAGSAVLTAAQNLTLEAQTTVSGNLSLSGGNITTQGVATGGNLTAVALGVLDTSAGQMTAAYDSSAPGLNVSGNATLSGAIVKTANAVIGGAYRATASQSLDTGGTAAYLGDAVLEAASVTNEGSQLSAGNLGISGTEVNNTGTLSSLETVSVAATDLSNSGTIYGDAATLTVAQSLVNTGVLQATTALNITTSTLNNTDGVIYGGDVSDAASSGGSVSIKVSGTEVGAFSNADGEILAANSVALSLPGQTIDPSAASMGTIDAGTAYSLSALAINNTGTWVLPETAVDVTTNGALLNTGVISQAGGSLALNGAVSNTGTVTVQDLTINGSLSNSAAGLVQANDTLVLNGAGVNAGTVEAENALTINGTSYDNSGGTTEVGNATTGAGDMEIDLSGSLTNAGGTITAADDLTITAASVINSGANLSGTTTTTTTIDNAALLDSTVVGSENIEIVNEDSGSGVPDSSFSVPLTLGNLLSPGGAEYSTSLSRVIPAGLYMTLDPSVYEPVASTGSVEFVLASTWGYLGNGWVLDENGSVPQSDLASYGGSFTATLPTVTETVTTSGSLNATSVIAAGNDLSITAGTLDNTGGTVSAGDDANISVQSLLNGSSTYSSTVTDTVDQTSLDTFLQTLASESSTAAFMVLGSSTNAWSQYCPSALTCSGWEDSEGYAARYVLDGAGTVTAPSVSSSVTVQGQAGQIVAGHNVNLSGGALTNAGSIAAGNDVEITATSFTNQGTNTGTMTTTAGCAAGFSAYCSSLLTTNPDSQTYTYDQINASVSAANDVVIAADAVNNTYGNIVAGRNVVIGGSGTVASDSVTSPTSLMQASSVVNTSGAIAAGNDVDISAGTFTNTVAAPVQIHQNYGSSTPYTGCSGDCEAYVDVQSANAATITASHDVNLDAVTFSNTGSLITALNDVTIDASSSASSDNQYLSAYWHADLTFYNDNYPSWGCAGNTSLCATLYGSSYSSTQAQDPAGLPDAVGLPDFVAGTIQAG